MAGSALDNIPVKKDEIWVPACPQCGNRNILLALADQFTHAIPRLWEVYCSECRWKRALEDVQKTLYVRM